jgi:prevent-host-death family protein
LTKLAGSAKSGLSLDEIMTTQVAAFDAKQKLSELLTRAHGGETIIITRHGMPYAKLVPLEEVRDLEAAKKRLFDRLDRQTARNKILPTREEIYDEATYLPESQRLGRAVGE